MTKPVLLTAAVIRALAGSPAAQSGGDAAAGKAGATSCAMCHGPNGEGTRIAPKLAGMDPARFVAALNDFKAGKISNAMMKAQADKLSAQQEADLAAYYAALK